MRAHQINSARAQTIRKCATAGGAHLLGRVRVFFYDKIAFSMAISAHIAFLVRNCGSKNFYRIFLIASSKTRFFVYLRRRRVNKIMARYFWQVFCYFR